jgi:hypothetical protein
MDQWIIGVVALTLLLRTGDDNFFLVIAPADKEMVNKSQMKLQRWAIILD